MLLPEQYSIEIPASKLDGYLLNRSHDLGWSKANYFFEHGVNTTNLLKNVLLQIISQGSPTEEIKNEFGSKYIVDGTIVDFNIRLRTVWIVLKGENICRFVTAYPL